MGCKFFFLTFIIQCPISAHVDNPTHQLRPLLMPCGRMAWAGVAMCFCQLAKGALRYMGAWRPTTV